MGKHRAKLTTLILLLADVKLRFSKDGGQSNNFLKGQKVAKLITLRRICIVVPICIYVHTYMHAVGIESRAKFSLLKELLAAEPSVSSDIPGPQEHGPDFRRNGTKFYRMRVQILSFLLRLEISNFYKSQNF